MTITVDATAADATIAEMSDELIFLIASAATDEQRKYAADLFRYFAGVVARDAYQRGRRDGAALPANVPADVGERLQGDAAIAPGVGDGDAVSIVPQAAGESED
jgi:hypothetical protein